ncbi:MAG: glycosyltransferase [Gammaproteobacteria bacterium]|nr:glycosyltransferase [Gammaproteobacteria bacterium]
MRIAILHHHLRPGGVTRVMENAVASLDGSGHECTVLIGEPCPQRSPLRDVARTVDGLKYRASAGNLTAQELALRLRTAAGPPPDVWHFHNHCLGKNVLLADAIAILAQQGENLLLQIHDFAEDGRPANYAVASQAKSLYPQSARCHYAVLNGRDYSILKGAGLAPDRLHLLPNPVMVPEIRATSFATGRRVLFYPTRGIRRKNIGELILLAVLLSEHGFGVATSLAPDNEVWRPVHAGWEAFARQHQISASLGVVQNTAYGSHSFGEWMTTADAIVTTSITEGFGLVFLEPFLFNKPLVGRDLPDVTRDFRALGLSFAGLYQRLLAPCDWIALEPIEAQISELISRQYQICGQTAPPGAAKRALGAICHEHYIDFGGLGEPAQKAVILRCLASPPAREAVSVLLSNGAVLGAANWLVASINQPVKQECAALLEEHFSLSTYGRKLASIYQTVANGDGAMTLFDQEPFDQKKVLTAFLSPENFHCLKTA